jgi:hypothetical protein
MTPDQISQMKAEGSQVIIPETREELEGRFQRRAFNCFVRWIAFPTVSIPAYLILGWVFDRFELDYFALFALPLGFAASVFVTIKTRKRLVSDVTALKGNVVQNNWAGRYRACGSGWNEMYWWEKIVGDLDLSIRIITMPVYANLQNGGQVVGSLTIVGQGSLVRLKKFFEIEESDKKAAKKDPTVKENHTVMKLIGSAISNRIETLALLTTWEQFPLEQIQWLKTLDKEFAGRVQNVTTEGSVEEDKVSGLEEETGFDIHWISCGFTRDKKMNQILEGQEATARLAIASKGLMLDDSLSAEKAEDNALVAMGLATKEIKKVDTTGSGNFESSLFGTISGMTGNKNSGGK